MAKSAAQRQAEYRQRHLKSEDGNLARLNLVIDTMAKVRLERLAACYGVTQQEMLERVIGLAERMTLDGLPSGQHGAYYDRRLPPGAVGWEDTP